MKRDAIAMIMLKCFVLFLIAGTVPMNQAAAGGQETSRGDLEKGAAATVRGTYLSDWECTGWSELDRVCLSERKSRQWLLAPVPGVERQSGMVLGITPVHIGGASRNGACRQRIGGVGGGKTYHQNTCHIAVFVG
jgi:hypothetical protein